jgi:hypothetical protein
MSAASDAASTFLIQGRRVTLPCRVRDASSAAASFLVKSAPARRLLPSPELDIVEVLPGRALLSVAAVDYRDNDLGDYDEISLALFVRERRASGGIPFLGPALDLMRGRLPTCILHLPVDQEFTCEAGRTIWGFPKTVDHLRFEPEPGRLRCRWEQGGRHVLTFVAPRGGSRSMPEQTLTTYSVLEGALHRTRFVSRADEVGFRAGGVALELGDHPIADDLRALGLPRAALFSVWMGHMEARFEAPEKL